MKVLIGEQLVNYVDIGAGKSVLILHGWGSSTKVFAEVIKELSKNHRIIAPDFPGFGESVEPDSVWGVSEYVEFVRDFLAKIEVRPDVIICHSFGGRVVLKGVGEGLLGAKQLIFIDAAGIRPKQSAKNKTLAHMSKIGKVLFRGKLGERVRKGVYQKIGVSDYVEASPLMREIFKKTVGEDLREYIPKIKVPSLIIWGENDADTPVADAYEFAKIKGSTLKIIPDAGHYVFLDKTEQVLREIKEFIE